LFHRLQPVADGIGARDAGADLDGEMCGDFAVLDDIDAPVQLEDDGAGISAHEGITANVFAAFDGFEQEGFARPANLAIGGRGVSKSARIRRVTGMRLPCAASFRNSVCVG